jgi:hypothetical protein
MQCYEIDILQDPFRPVGNGGFSVGTPTWFTGTNSSATQQNLQTLIPQLGVQEMPRISAAVPKPGCTTTKPLLAPIRQMFDDIGAQDACVQLHELSIRHLQDAAAFKAKFPVADFLNPMFKECSIPQGAELIIYFLIIEPGHADPVDDYINREIHAKHIPGMAVVVLKDGVVVKEKAYGTANIEFTEPATLQDVYPIASITKLFTTVAVFMLVQEGKIHLKDKITDLLPGLPASWKDVTVLNCLSHTSGIPDLHQIYDSWSVPLTQEDALGAISSKPIE